MALSGGRGSNPGTDDRSSGTFSTHTFPRTLAAAALFLNSDSPPTKMLTYTVSFMGVSTVVANSGYFARNFAPRASASSIHFRVAGRSK